MKTIKIDITPTWSAVLPPLLVLLQDGNRAGREFAKKELKRMAQLADAYADGRRGAR